MDSFTLKMHKNCSFSPLFLALWLRSGLFTYIWGRNLMFSDTLNWFFFFFYGITTEEAVNQAWDHTCDLLHDRLRWSELDVGISHWSHSLLSNHLLFYVRKLWLSFQLNHLGISQKLDFLSDSSARWVGPSCGLPAPQLRLTSCGGGLRSAVKGAVRRSSRWV